MMESTSTRPSVHELPQQQQQQGQQQLRPMAAGHLSRCLPLQRRLLLHQVGAARRSRSLLLLQQLLSSRRLPVLLPSSRLLIWLRR